MSFLRKKISELSKEVTTQRALSRVEGMLLSRKWKDDAAKREELIDLLKLHGQQLVNRYLRSLDPKLIRKLVLISDPPGPEHTERFGFVQLIAIIEVGASYLIDERIIDCVTELAHSRSDGVRINAARVLVAIEGAQRSGKTLPVLISLLLNDKAYAVRASVAEYLQCITWNDTVVEALISALGDHDFQYEFTGSLFSPRTLSVSEKAILSLIAIGNEKGIRAIVPKLLSGDSFADGTREPRKTIDMLRQIGDQAIPSIIETLEMEDPKYRKRAVRALGEIGDYSALSLLTDLLLSDEDRDVRALAADALAKLGDERVAEPLSQALKDTDKKVRKAAANALEKIRSNC